MKYIALLLLVTLWFVLAHPAQASFCRTSDRRVICIKSIKRSAKNYWEYRAVVSIDGVARPLEVYNCRYPPNSGQKWKTTSFIAEVASLSYKLRFGGHDTYGCFRCL
ncbi:hypothetical protein [Microseira sp. BLCC-F43]|uniref:hypothetical protein n=1 Tax=Microseira sp. BLCC-F43 TaxID=3153602 RepID=UPI0035B7D92C